MRLLRNHRARTHHRRRHGKRRHVLQVQGIERIAQGFVGRGRQRLKGEPRLPLGQSGQPTCCDVDARLPDLAQRHIPTEVLHSLFLHAKADAHFLDLSQDLPGVRRLLLADLRRVHKMGIHPIRRDPDGRQHAQEPAPDGDVAEPVGRQATGVVRNHAIPGLERLQRVVVDPRHLLAEHVTPRLDLVLSLHLHQHIPRGGRDHRAAVAPDHLDIRVAHQVVDLPKGLAGQMRRLTRIGHAHALQKVVADLFLLYVDRRLSFCHKHISHRVTCPVCLFQRLLQPVFPDAPHHACLPERVPGLLKGGTRKHSFQMRLHTICRDDHLQTAVVRAARRLRRAGRFLTSLCHRLCRLLEERL